MFLKIPPRNKAYSQYCLQITLLQYSTESYPKKKTNKKNTKIKLKVGNIWKVNGFSLRLQCYDIQLTGDPLNMQLRCEVVPHLRDIAVLFTRQLDAEAIWLQRRSGGPRRLDRFVLAHWSRCDLGQGGLLRPGAVATAAFMVKQHAWRTPHFVTLALHFGTNTVGLCDHRLDIWKERIGLF